MDLAVPPSTISTLSSGEFVGIVADNPDQEISLKRFHCKIINDHQALASEEKSFKIIPKVRQLSEKEVNQNYQRIKSDIQLLIEMELERMMDSPGLTGLIIQRR